MAQFLDKQGGLSYVQRLSILRDVAHTMTAIHSCGFMHRDLKPLNIMMCKEAGTLRGKIGDFGFAKEISASSLRPGFAKGTLFYMAPESFNGTYSYFTDVFAFGIMMNELISGEEPYKGEQFVSEHQFIAMVCKNNKRPIMFTPSNDTEGRLLQIVQSCISAREGLRPSFDTLSKQLDGILSLYSMTMMKGSAFVAILQAPKKIEGGDSNKIPLSSLSTNELLGMLKSLDAPAKFRQYIIDNEITGQVFEDCIDLDTMKSLELNDIHAKFLSKKINAFTQSGGIPLEVIRQGLDNLSAEDYPATL